MEDNNGAYNNGNNPDIQISRTPSRSYNENSTMDLLVARNEVNRQTQQFLDQIKNMTTEINGILKSIEDSNSKGSKSLEKSATLFLAKMKEAQETGEMSTKSQLNFMQDYAKILSKAAETTITTKGVTDEQIKNANRLLKISDEYIQRAEEFSNALKGSVDNLATRLSKGIGSFRKDFQDLANTLNIDKLVNGSSISNKIDIMNQTKQNFGITTNKEFETFKNDLINQMQDLNSQFGQSLLGTEDLKNYLQNASAIGITQTSVAQDQLQALLIGNKYLGQSLESQSMLYKYMKRSGDNDLSNKWNKIIVGLLNSQLNLSKEELDNLTKSNLELGDQLYSMGMSNDVVNSFVEDNMAVTGSISSALGEGKGSQYNDFLSSILDSTNPIFTNLQYRLTNMIKSGASGEDVLNEVMGDSVLNNIMNTLEKSSNPQAVLSAYDLDENSVSIYRNMNENLGKILNNIKEGNYSIDEALNDKNSVTDYVKNTTVASLEERLMNKLGLIFDKVPWGAFVTMGNVAFGLFIAQKGFEAIGGLVNFFKGGGFTKLLDGSKLGQSVMQGGEQLSLFTSGGGKLGSILGSVATVGGGIVLGLSAANMIKSAIVSATNEKQSSNISAAEGQLEGTKLEGNSAAASAMGFADTYADNGANKALAFGQAWNTTTRGIGVGLLGWTRDLSTINQDYWEFFRENLAMRRMDKDDVMAYTTAWALLLMSAGRKSDVSDFANYTTDDIKELIQYYGWTKDYLNRVADDSSPKPNKTKSEDQETIDWEKLGLSNVGGAGDTAGLGANMGGGSSVPSGYPWTGTAGYPTYPSGKKHTGIDFGISQGTPVGAAVSGTVSQVNDSGSKGYGRHVIVQGDNGKWFVYGHLSQPKVSKGQHVEAGNLIGLSGNTGNSTGPHLHFEARNNSRYGSDISPYPYLTNGLFSPNGQASGNLVQANTTANSEDDTKTDLNKQAGIRYNTRISALSGVTTLGMGGAEPDTTSLESTMNKKFDELIGVITSLSERQDSDSMILQALSNSTRRPAEFGGVR